MFCCYDAVSLDWVLSRIYFVYVFCCFSIIGSLASLSNGCIDI